MKQPRPEFPRPDFQRAAWMNLNGPWEFAFDEENKGIARGWRSGHAFPLEIIVPFCYQSKASGIGDTRLCDVIWYRKLVSLPEAFDGKRVLLHFGAVDYQAGVWVNGNFAAQHRGGHTPFYADITDYLTDGENEIVLRAEDRTELSQPRGKQYWKAEEEGIWYTPTSGIWQTVWLEAVGTVWLDSIRITPDIDRGTAEAELVLSRSCKADVELALHYEGTPLKTLRTQAQGRMFNITLDIQELHPVDNIHYWSPQHPNLYGVTVRLLEEGQEADRVETYFGMRKIVCENGRILLNNMQLYQKLVLDQGYWADSLMTPPSDDAIRQDIELAKKMGFNGVRKHQKIEDPRFYYWADRMGLLVWGELPSAYAFSSVENEQLIDEMQAFIQRDYNHPSIITWVPMNESWGVRYVYGNQRQQAFVRALYYLVKSADPTRLVSGNDGWEQSDTDICGIHDYNDSGEAFRKRYVDIHHALVEAAPGKRPLAEGARYGGQPILITEYGGIAMRDGSNAKNWGYHGPVENEEQFFQRLESVTHAIQDIPFVVGYCYTQLTDVMQEINGLLRADRSPKVDLDRVRLMNSRV